MVARCYTHDRYVMTFVVVRSLAPEHSPRARASNGEALDATVKGVNQNTRVTGLDFKLKSDVSGPVLFPQAVGDIYAICEMIFNDSKASFYLDVEARR